MFTKKGKYFYREGRSNQPYDLKLCQNCQKQQLIPVPNGKYCSHECRAQAQSDGYFMVREETKAKRTYTKAYYILSIDPGSVRTGYALFEHESHQEHSVLLRKGVVSFDSLNDFLTKMTYITHLVYENYRIRPGGRQNVGSDGKVMQVIGKLDMWSQTQGLRPTKQEPAVLPIAAKIAGFTMPKGHLRDDDSAYLHGVYYLRKRGWWVSELEKEKAS